MRLKTDENLHDEVAAMLVAAGHDALTVVEQGNGSRDRRGPRNPLPQEKRALLTLDLDFADIRTFPPADYSGLIVLRVHDQSRPHVLRVTAMVLRYLQREPIDGHLWILSESGIRIRG